jgi:hypothetical protein
MYEAIKIIEERIKLLVSLGFLSIIRLGSIGSGSFIKVGAVFLVVIRGFLSN